MVPNGEGWHDLAVIKLLALLWGITSKNIGDFFLFNLPSFFPDKKFQPTKKNLKTKIFVKLHFLPKSIKY